MEVQSYFYEYLFSFIFHILLLVKYYFIHYVEIINVSISISVFY